MLPATSFCAIEDIESVWKKCLNDDLDFDGNDNTKKLTSKFQSRSPEFNDRIRIVNVTRLLEMHMYENLKFKVLNTEETKKLLFNISLQISAMHAKSRSLKTRFERVSDQKYMKKLWLYMSYLYFPITNDKIGTSFMQKLFDILKSLLMHFPEILEKNLKLEEQRDELINLTKNIAPSLLSTFKDLGAARIRIEETRLETKHVDSLMINALKLFSKPDEHIIDDPKDVPVAEIQNTLNSIKTHENEIKNIFAKKPFQKNLKEAEFCMGLLYEFDCLKFTYKALLTLKSIKIPATQNFTVTENEIIPVLQAVVFLGESLNTAAGIRENADHDNTIIRTLISLRNIVEHKMSSKKFNNYFWNGLLKELNEMTEKIENRMDYLRTLFLEEDLTQLIDKKNEICLDDISVTKKPNIAKTNKANKKLMTIEEEIDSRLEEPPWQHHNYKFLRSWLRALQYRNYNIVDPLTEDIREVAKGFLGPKPKPEHPVYTYNSLIKSVLENVNKIEQLLKNNINSETLADKLQANSDRNDITLFLKLTYFLHQICQAFKDVSKSNDNKKGRKTSDSVNEIWQELSQKLDKMGEHRLFEFLYTQIENARSLCIHSLWINENEYQRFANVIHLILSNLKPMLLRLSYTKPVLLPGICYFANTLISKIGKIEKLFSNAFFFIRFQAVECVNECDSKLLADYIKQDRQLKLYFKFRNFIIQIFNTLQQCQWNNKLMWKRFMSEIILLNQQQKLETIYTNLEYANNISLRSLWKNSDEYRIFADTVLLIINKFKPMLLLLKKKKFSKWKKQKVIGSRMNYRIKQQKCVFDQQKQIREDTVNLWWQLLLIKATTAPLTVKKSSKFEQKIILLLKKYRIVTSDGFEENVSDLIEIFVKQFTECLKNLNQLEGWEDADIEFLDTTNLINSLHNSLHQSKPEINLPGIHNRTPLLYILSLQNSMPSRNLHGYIFTLIKILLNHGADPDKFSALTLHPLHYTALMIPAFTEYFQEKCIFKNPCDGFSGLNIAMLLRNLLSFYSDADDEDNFIDDTFFNAIFHADKIHYSFPNYGIPDTNYFLNTYDQNGRTPLICATDTPYLHDQWKSNLEIISQADANVNDKEIVSFNNGKPVFGDSALKKVLSVELSGYPWKIEKPQPDLNTRKAIAKYLISNGVDKDELKYFAAMSLFSVIKHKLFLLHDSPELHESIKNIDEIIEFWFVITILLCDMPYDGAHENFKSDQLKWINELLVGIKPANVDKNDPHESLRSSKVENFIEHVHDSDKVSTVNNLKTYKTANVILKNQFLLLPTEKLMIFDSDDENLFWQYSLIKNSIVIIKKRSKPISSAEYFSLIYLKKRSKQKRQHQRWRQRFSAHVCYLITGIILKDCYQCNNCKKKKVIAQLRTNCDNAIYLETNQIEHVCQIQDLIKQERVYKQSDCEFDINLNGIQEMTIVHPFDKQWVFEFEFDENLNVFCCKKCKEYERTVIAKFWKNKKEEDVIILGDIQHCYKLYQICSQTYYNFSLL